MSTTSWPSRLSRGVGAQPWRTFGFGYLAFTGLWQPAEPIVSLWEGWSPDYNPYLLFALLLGGILWALARATHPQQVKFTFPNTKTVFSITVADLFEAEGHKVIPVNEFFDSKLGSHVNEGSLHGQSINNLFGGDQARFARLLDKQLPQRDFEIVARSDGGKTKRFPIGTVVGLAHGRHRIFFTALSHTDLDTRKATADVHDLMKAWTGTWRAVRAESNGEAVAVPLMGAGQSNVGLSYQDLLHSLLISFAHESRLQGITKHVTVCLDEAAFAKLNLRTLKEEMVL